MKARIRVKENRLRAECGNKNCGRFLSEIHGSTNIIVRCSSCKRDNSIKILYSNS
jgi:phage FluMu protein Com